jgi:hypothetical protein
MEELREAAAGSRACHLWKLGTRTVFGEGPPTARMLLERRAGLFRGVVEDLRAAAQAA